MPEKEVVDPLKELADSLREKKGVPWSVAKLELGGESSYVEFFRGKDFQRYFQQHPEKLANVLPARAGRSVDDQIIDLMVMLLKRRFVRKAERRYKKPKPGKKRLVKFPKTLIPRAEPGGWSESAFYAWTYDRPTSIWSHVGTVLLPVIVIAGCLFPLAPWYVRMTLVYFLMALLALLLGLIAVRYVLFGAVWIATGSSFWLFPNMMSDEASIFDAFTPVITYATAGKGKRQYVARTATLAFAAGTVYMLYQHSPDAQQLKQQAKEAHDSLFDFLDVYGRNKAKGYLTNSTSNATASGRGWSGGYRPAGYRPGDFSGGNRGGPGYKPGNN